MQIQTVLLILAAFLLALGAAVFHYNTTKASLKQRILYTFLRFVALFSGLVLLINPEFPKNSYHTEKANLNDGLKFPLSTVILAATHQ